MPRMLELRLTFQLPNDRLNEHPFLEHQGIKIRQRFRLHVLANFVNQVNTFGLQRLTQLFGDIPFTLKVREAFALLPPFLTKSRTRLRKSMEYLIRLRGYHNSHDLAGIKCQYIY